MPNKIDFARLVVQNMTGNTYFSDPIPSLDIIGTLTNELQTTYDNSRDAGKTETDLMYDKEFELDTQLRDLGNYVERIANNNNASGSAIIHSAGMDIRDTAIRQEQVFTVKNTEQIGFVVLTSRSEGRASYVWEHSLDQATWTQGNVTTTAEATISDLTRGELYHFRCAIVTNGDNQGPWQGPISLTVT